MFSKPFSSRYKEETTIHGADVTSAGRSFHVTRLQILQWSLMTFYTFPGILIPIVVFRLDLLTTMSAKLHMCVRNADTPSINAFWDKVLSFMRYDIIMHTVRRYYSCQQREYCAVTGVEQCTDWLCTSVSVVILHPCHWRAIPAETPVGFLQPTCCIAVQSRHHRQAGFSSFRRQLLEQSSITRDLCTVARDIQTSP